MLRRKIFARRNTLLGSKAELLHDVPLLRRVDADAVRRRGGQDA